MQIAQPAAEGNEPIAKVVERIKTVERLSIWACLPEFHQNYKTFNNSNITNHGIAAQSCKRLFVPSAVIGGKSCLNAFKLNEDSALLQSAFFDCSGHASVLKIYPLRPSN
jgi:hypothetical protein